MQPLKSIAQNKNTAVGRTDMQPSPHQRRAVQVPRNAQDVGEKGTGQQLQNFLDLARGLLSESLYIEVGSFHDTAIFEESGVRFRFSILRHQVPMWQNC